jgi:hypothetical protein
LTPWWSFSFGTFSTNSTGRTIPLCASSVSPIHTTQ